MKKAYLKDIVREIKKTRKRYISIIAIVILGVALYVGINASSPDMLRTLNKYLNDYNVYDLNFVSTVGFEDKDIEQIQKMEDISYIDKVKSTYVIVEKEEKEKVINVISIPKQTTQNTINRYEMVEGTYPTEQNQIVLDSKLKGEYNLGDTIEFVDAEAGDLKDVFKTTKYTVVGFANSPLYISMSRGNTTLVDGTVYGFALVLENAFSLEQYTNIYARVNTNNIDRTSDEYIQEIESVQDKIEGKIDSLAENKAQDIKQEGNDKIEEAKKEIQDAKDELENAENEIENAKIKLEDAENELVSQKQNFYTQINKYEEQIEEGEKTLASTKNMLDSKQEELNNGLETLEQKEKELQNAEKQLLESSGVNDLNTYLEYLQSISAPEELISNVKNLISGKEEIKNQKQMLNEYVEQLEEGKEEYSKGVEELGEQKQELKNNKKTAESRFISAQNEIDNGWKELKENESKFNEEKEEAFKEIEDAEEEIAKNEKDLEDLSVKIYALNLETNEGYVSYKSDCDSVSTIGKVFPIIFFLVAALVSLTAMTRMVEENRGNIGTYKSLGYSKYKISLKYLLYSISATLSGAILGTIIGSYTLPWIVAKTYGILYTTMPSVLMNINMKYALIAGVSAFAATTLATILGCYKILRETPANLMRPKTPKEGKKIFLERIPFIWKHLKFIQKITARNVFRYKKRLFMTIIGIAGCTALIFTGFGLRDSIASIVSKQYGEIRNYDFELTLKDGLTDKKIEELNKYIQKEIPNTKYTYLRQQTNNVSANGNEQNVYIVGVDDKEELTDFVNMQDRETKQHISIQKDGVIITEKLSKLLNVTVGSEITIEISDDNYKNVKVTGIIENYIYHYIYMDKEVYEQTFNEKMIDNQIYLKANEELGDEREEQISKYLLENDNISQVLKISTISDSFTDMIGSLDIIVIVLIICAALLAFVVLYNLNSINIEERKRELATIKLLGFYNKELSSYVFRENIILTLLGVVIGLILGVYLLFFIISTAEMDIVMFGRETYITSYIFAFLMTVVFAILINLIMNKELKKIDMIASLKSVE